MSCGAGRLSRAPCASTALSKHVTPSDRSFSDRRFGGEKNVRRHVSMPVVGWVMPVKSCSDSYHNTTIVVM